MGSRGSISLDSAAVFGWILTSAVAAYHEITGTWVFQMVLYADAVLPTYVIPEFLIIQGGSLSLPNAAVPREVIMMMIFIIPGV